MLGTAHLAAVTTALVLATAVLVLPKGTRQHRRTGTAYVAVLIVGNGVALLLREESGGFGAFHVFAVVSLVTLAGGVATSPRRRRGAVAAHARFLLWSIVGLTAAGLAQLANSVLSEQAPWPVLLVTSASVAVGLVAVPAAADSATRGGQRPARPR